MSFITSSWRTAFGGSLVSDLGCILNSTLSSPVARTRVYARLLLFLPSLFLPSLPPFLPHVFLPSSLMHGILDHTRCNRMPCSECLVVSSFGIHVSAASKAAFSRAISDTHGAARSPRGNKASVECIPSCLVSLANEVNVRLLGREGDSKGVTSNHLAYRSAHFPLEEMIPSCLLLLAYRLEWNGLNCTPYFRTSVLTVGLVAC